MAVSALACVVVNACTSVEVNAPIWVVESRPTSVEVNAPTWVSVSWPIAVVVRPLSWVVDSLVKSTASSAVVDTALSWVVVRPWT